VLGGAPEKTGVALRGGYTLRVQTRSSYVRTFIAHELQFRDGSGLIQFNGVPGELYARRHLVSRSADIYIYIYADVYIYARMHVSVYAYVRAYANPRDVYRDWERGGGEGTSTRRA